MPADIISKFAKIMLCFFIIFRFTFFCRRRGFIKRRKRRTHNFSLWLFAYEMSVNFDHIVISLYRFYIKLFDGYQNVICFVSPTDFWLCTESDLRAKKSFDNNLTIQKCLLIANSFTNISINICFPYEKWIFLIFF